jgi:type VI secretion system secreted protein Hcp
MAKTNIYLKLEGIEGESTDENHKGWIELDQFTWGVKNDASFAIGQGGQATQGHVGKIKVDKVCDKSSITLFKNCTTGKHITGGTISCLKLDGEARIEYLNIELKDIMVSSVDWTGAGTEAVLKESVELEFAEFKKVYTLQEDKGSPGGAKEFAYNRQTSKAA